MTGNEIRDLQKTEQPARFPAPGGRGQLVYIPPGYELAAEKNEPPAPETHLWDYIWLIWRGRWVVALVLIIAVTIAAWRLHRAQPIYQAAAKLQVSAQAPRVVNVDGVDQNAIGNDTSRAGSLNTQMIVLRSRTLAREVVDRLDLYAPSSRKPREPGLVDKVRSLLVKTFRTGYTQVRGKLAERFPALTPDEHPPPAPPRPLSPEQIAELRAAARVDAFLGALSVKNITGTEILEIRFSDRRSSVTAAVCNAVCDAYIRLSRETKANSYEYASQWISDKLADEKARLEKSEQALYEFGGGKDALALVEDADKSAANLSQMRQTLIEAERDLNSCRFILEAIRDGEISETAPFIESVGGSDLGRLRTELAQREVQYDEAMEQFGPRMSQVKALKAAKARLETQIDEERERLLALARNAVEKAEAERDFAEATLHDQEQRLLDIKQRLIEYNILKREVDVNKELYNTLLQRSREVGLSSELKADNVTVVERAEPPRFPVYPDRRRTLFLGAVIGLALGIGLVFFREYMNTTVRGAIDVERIGRMATLGFLPRIEKRHSGKSRRLQPAFITSKDPRSLFAENVRQVRTSIQYSRAGGPPKSILVTSALGGEGKTTVAANLAASFAQNGRKTVLVDADLKKPADRKCLYLSREHGLSDILAGGVNGNLATSLIRSSDTENLYILPSGAPAPNPVDLLDSKQMRLLLRILNASFDHVILDSAPALDMADSGVLFQEVDGVVVVVKPGRTPRNSLARVRAKITTFGGHILGVVLNNRKDRSRKRSSLGAYYYGYDQFGADAAPVAAATAVDADAPPDSSEGEVAVLPRLSK